MKHATALAAQVAAWNRVNAEANRLAVELARIFAPFVGKKVTCNGGSLTAKCKALVPSDEWNTDGSLRVWQSCGSYALQFCVKACENQDCGDYCGNRYAETYVSVGELKDHILRAVNEPCTTRRTDYTEAEVLKLREEVQRTEEAFHDAESALSPFKRYDW